MKALIKLFMGIGFMSTIASADFGLKEMELLDAIEQNSVTGVEQALRSGANPRFRGFLNETVLMSLSLKSPDIARILIAHGVDINAQDVNGQTALDYITQGATYAGNQSVQFVPLINYLINIGGKTGEQLQRSNTAPGVNW